MLEKYYYDDPMNNYYLMMFDGQFCKICKCQCGLNLIEHSNGKKHKKILQKMKNKNKIK